MADLTKPCRYAHTEGHTDLCFDADGSHLLTCGQDGDVRVWKSLDEDDPTSYRLGEQVFSVLLKNNRIFTMSDSNSVQASTFPDGAPDGIITRFTTHGTHMCVNETGTYIVAGSSDFTLKYVEIETGDNKTFQSHEAPILSVALDPKEEFIATSSCDGTVKVWKIETQECVKTFQNVLKPSSDFSASTSLCRLTWHPHTRQLIIPTQKCVAVYECHTWKSLYTLADDNIKEIVSLVALSPCKNYLALACLDGLIQVWNLKGTRKACLSMKHSKGLTISALVFNPSGNKDLVYADNQGSLGVIKNSIPESNSLTEDSNKVDSPAEWMDAFDSDDDDLVGEAASGQLTDDITVYNETGPVVPHSKAAKNSMDLEPKVNDDDDVESCSAVTDVQPSRALSAPTTPLQKAFQPSSTPVHLSQRFMVWNSVGIIKQYSTEEEYSIDIEFHDTATHHALHIDNSTLNHTMAALSDQAVVLACEGDSDSLSQLVCMHFGSWDGNKEWTSVMPKGEVIQVVAIGDGWIAIATSKRLVRIFSIGGVQTEIISIPGNVVTMAAHSNQLMITYHQGPGLPGDQNLGIQLLQVRGKKKRKLINGDQLPLTAKSTLSWLGFSAEGTPVIIDSTGVVCILNRGFCSTWTRIADLKKQLKGKSDNYWMVAVYENAQQMRCIHCKGSTYPPVLPRPTISILSFEVPVCDLTTEKGALEESYIRHDVLGGYVDYWASQGMALDDDDKHEIIRPKKEALMKMFALACQCERDVRAVEVCELMPDSYTVQLAIKYASRLGRIQLAERISEIAQTKCEEETEALFEEDTSHRPATNGWSNADRDAAEDDIEDELVDENNDIEEIDDNTKKEPLLNLDPKQEREAKNPFSSSGSTKNPFKVGSQSQSQSQSSNQSRGSRVFDDMDVTRKRSKVNKSPADKSPEMVLKPKPVVRKQGRIVFNKNQNKTKTKSDTVQTTDDRNENENTENVTEFKKKSAFDMWFEANKESIETESPDLDEEDLIKIAAEKFTAVPREERKEWLDKSKEYNTLEGNIERKRKRDTDIDEAGISKPVNCSEQSLSKKKKPLTQSTNSKLSAFKRD